MAMDEEIEKRFTPQSTTAPQRARLECLREAAKAFTEALREHCPPGRERDLAELNTEQAAMWASKAVTHASKGMRLLATPDLDIPPDGPENDPRF